MIPVPEAAEIIGVSPNTLRRAGDAGEIPMERIRGVCLLPRTWVEHFTSWPKPELAVAS
jgi:excisionase family DNA binding protein